jgi:hypothetical protein
VLLHRGRASILPPRILLRAGPPSPYRPIVVALDKFRAVALHCVHELRHRPRFEQVIAGWERARPAGRSWATAEPERESVAFTDSRHEIVNRRQGGVCRGCDDREFFADGPCLEFRWYDRISRLT